MSNKTFEWNKLYLDYEEHAYPIDNDFDNSFRRSGLIKGWYEIILPLIQRLQAIVDLEKGPEKTLEQRMAESALRDLRKFMIKRSQVARAEAPTPEEGK